MIQMQSKISSILICFFVLPILLLAEESESRFESSYDEFIITKDSMIYNNLTGFEGIPDQIKVDNYSITIIDHIPFIVDEENQKKFLMLKNDEILSVYVEGRDRVIFSGILDKYFIKEGLISPWDSVVSSYLKEGKTEYLPINMGRKRLELPWVEGVDGQGIGETITFSMGPFSGIYIYNGFISFRRPELYLMNSRVKSLIVRDLDSGSEKIVELEDTPNPQLIDIPESKKHKIELEILDVYPGTKYDDTCIAGIALKGF